MRLPKEIKKREEKAEYLLREAVVSRGGLKKEKSARIVEGRTVLEEDREESQERQEDAGAT